MRAPGPAQFLATAVLLLLPLLALAAKLPASFKVDATAQFLCGDYVLIGKASDSERIYKGRVSISYTGNNQFVVTRRIEDRTTTAKGFFDAASPPAEKPPVLRIRFRQDGREFEATYLWSNDLDNYARLTGYVYLRQGSTNSPGLEALFPAPTLTRPDAAKK